MAFTSGLSVEEFTLAQSAGLRPLGLVGGAGVYRFGAQRSRSNGSTIHFLDFPRDLVRRSARIRYGMNPGETKLVCKGTDNWTWGREQALSRLGQEARDRGANLVTGIRMRSSRITDDFSGTFHQITATGTAMIADRLLLNGPALTTMTVSDYTALARTGHYPVGIVMSAARTVGRVKPSWRGRLAQERPEYSEATRLAYAAAADDLTSAARRLGAHGVTAITITRSVEREDGGFSLLARAAGTAVLSVPAARQKSGPLTIVPVRRVHG